MTNNDAMKLEFLRAIDVFVFELDRIDHKTEGENPPDWWRTLNRVRQDLINYRNDQRRRLDTPFKDKLEARPS